ncbi:MAG: fibronectin type III domain-containing protein, partial [Bacteroidales bacterium]
MKKFLLFFNVLFLLILYGHAQTITIGTGTTGKYTIPVNTFYNYSYVQEIFLASEMEDLTDSIYSISFQYIHSSPQTKNPVTIYLGNTTKTNFSSSSDWVPASAMNQVFQGSVTFNPNSWVTITFTTPFIWDGSSNIVVAILNNTGDYTTYGDNTFYTHSTSNNKAIHAYDDYAPFNAASPANGTLINFRNNVRFEYGPIPTCPKPRNFATANIGVNESTVFWTTGNVETQWEYVYGPQGTVDLQTATPIVVSDTFVSLSNLISNTIYDVYVRAVCETESSRWMQGSFRTLCGTVMTLPYTENFDAYGTTNYPKPICWSRSTSQAISYPYISTTNTVSTPASFYFNSSPTTYCVATTEPFDAALLGEDLMISFNMRAAGDGNIQVGLMSDPNDLSTFERIATVVPSVQNLWQEFNIQLTEYAGTGNRIAFLSDRRNENKNNEVYIDNLSIDYMPTCIRPENVRVTAHDATSITIQWDTYNSETEWLVSYGPLGYHPVDTSISMMVYDNPFTITGLTSATGYSVYVKSLCSGGDTTDWTNRVDASTLSTNIATFPYFCDFEDATENANWTLVNGTQTNRWVIRDTVNHTENGNQSLFITNNGNLNLYYIDSTSSVWAYRDIQLPEAPGFQLTFDWKTIGESSFDYFKIFIGSPAVVTAGSSTVPAEVTELGRFNNKADWQSDTVTIDATYGNSVQRLYFLWRNDY